MNEIESMREKVVTGFHTQFAENQRHAEASFLKVIGFLGAVVVAYALTYLALGESDSRVGDFEFTIVTLFCWLLVTLGMWLIGIFAYNFRRDQIVTSIIREELGLHGTYIPAEFNFRKQLSARGRFNWIPELYKVFYILFALTGALIPCVSALKLLKMHGQSCACVLMWLVPVSIVLAFLILVYYRHKLNKFK